MNPDIAGRKLLDAFCNVITIKAVGDDQRLHVSTGVRFLKNNLPSLPDAAINSRCVEAYVVESFRSAAGGSKDASCSGFIRNQVRQRIVSGSLDGVRQAYGGIETELDDMLD